MKKTKIIFALAAVLMLLFVFTGCKATEQQLAAYDDNELIASGSCGSISFGSVQSSINSKFKLKIKSFSGVKTIATMEIQNNPTIKLNLSVTGGQFKIVFVKNGAVTVLTDKDCDSQIDALIPAGKYDVKIVGREAQFELEIYFDFGDYTNRA